MTFWTMLKLWVAQQVVAFVAFIVGVVLVYVLIAIVTGGSRGE